MNTAIKTKSQEIDEAIDTILAYGHTVWPLGFGAYKAIWCSGDEDNLTAKELVEVAEEILQNEE
jgi:hypothetical protein